MRLRRHARRRGRAAGRAPAAPARTSRAPRCSPARGPLPARRARDPDPRRCDRAALDAIDDARPVPRLHEPATCAPSPSPGEWTRIGRSLAADLRFDDPTVSRRHALLVARPTASGCSTTAASTACSSTASASSGAAARRRRRDRRRPLPPALRRSRRRSVAVTRPPHRWRPSSIGALGRHDRSPLPEGRHRQDHDGAHAHRRLPPRRAAASSRSTSTRRATCRTTSTSIPRHRRRSATCSPAAPRPREAVHDDIIPANLSLAEAELMLAGKMGRELTLKRALKRRCEATTTSS